MSTSSRDAKLDLTLDRRISPGTGHGSFGHQHAQHPPGALPALRSNRGGAGRSGSESPRAERASPIPAFAVGTRANRRLTVLAAVSDGEIAEMALPLLRALEDVVVVGSVMSEHAAVEEASRLRPDLVFVDADERRSSGLRIADRLRFAGGPDVVVLSPGDSCAARAFEVSALDYLKVPIDPWRLRQAIDRARLRRAEREALIACAPDHAGPVVHVPDRHGGRDVPVARIIFIRADRDYAMIYADDRTYMLRSTMAMLNAQLAPSVLRVHRSALVSLAHVRRWKTSAKGAPSLELSNGQEIAVGPGYLSSVRAVLRHLDH